MTTIEQPAKAKHSIKDAKLPVTRARWTRSTKGTGLESTHREGETREKGEQAERKEKGEDKEIPAKAELKGKVGEDKEKVKAKEGAKHPGKERDAHLEKNCKHSEKNFYLFISDDKCFE